MDLNRKERDLGRVLLGLLVAALVIFLAVLILQWAWNASLATMWPMNVPRLTLLSAFALLLVALILFPRPMPVVVTQ